MPIVEYKCPTCGLVVEKLQTTSKTQKVICIGESDITAHNQFEMERVQFSVPAKRNPRYGVVS